MMDLYYYPITQRHPYKTKMFMTLSLSHMHHKYVFGKY